MNILILEDDEGRMIQFRKRMEAEGLDPSCIFHCLTSGGIIAQLEERRYDLIFLDHDIGGLPIEDGREDCGMRVAEWLSIRPEVVKANGPIIVHSINGPCAQQMVELIGSAIWAPFVWMAEEWVKFLKFPKP